MFQPLPGKVDFPQLEHDVLAFWKDNDVFARSVERRKGAKRFVFYEGPPTANGMPHPGHALTRAMKDIFPRYRTMTGSLVERKAGWDTHGLPVEIEVSKELGIHTKAEIEEYGIEAFIKLCLDSVFRYTTEWREMTDRLGFWLDMDDAYATFHESYVESVWWSLKTLFDRGHLYQGHKVVWWWPQGGTALSAGEVGEGYREVDDPSVFVRFPLVDEEGTSLLVWTTTPWTLISNHFAAVNPKLQYSVVRDEERGERLVIATELVERIGGLAGRKFVVEKTMPGTELVGRRYRPPFDPFYLEMGERTAPLVGGGEAHVGWRVLAADFVTLDSGTGLVHEAPAFGEVDFDLLQEERQRFMEPDDVPLLCAVEPDGSFTEVAGEAYAGRNIKEADKDIIAEMREGGLLYHREAYRHDYPFCPRAPEDPMIQYARASWFVRTSGFKDQFLANNNEVKWLPEHIQEGRFGDFLRNNVDWALSRERFWGTPLPIWKCEETGGMEAVESYDELTSKPGISGTEVWEEAKAADPSLHEALKIHRPWIDSVEYDSPFAEGARMKRVIEVIDCWWDAGSMPFAQWGYPHVEGSRERFKEMFPADFISEAIDQTRGWFYGLMSISTLLFQDDHTGPKTVADEDMPEPEPPFPYKACIVLGHMMGEDGLKMSKSKKNYRSPNYIFDTLGADAMRWYFYSAQPPWTSVRFQEAAIRDSQREFLVRLWNVLSFFNIYARIDGFDPGLGEGETASGWRPVAERGELDRWITSELHRTIRAVRTSMDGFENFPAAGELKSFVDALSNWYVRRSRERFWVEGEDQDKWDAYNTLYEVLVDVSKLIAPFTPFVADVFYRSLVAEPAAEAGLDDVAISVHLCDYPESDPERIDEALSEEMDVVRQLVSLGHAARSDAGLKVRQPLGEAEVVLAMPEQTARLQGYGDLIAEELNVHRVEFKNDADEYVAYSVKPNFRNMGPKHGKKVPRIAAALGAMDAGAVRGALVENGMVSVMVDGEAVELVADDVEVRLEAKPGWAAAPGRAGVVVIGTELTEELREEGMVRELIHHVQAARKAADLPYQARIRLAVETGDELRGILERHKETIARECLVEEFAWSVDGVDGVETVTVEGVEARVGIGVV